MSQVAKIAIEVEARVASAVAGMKKLADSTDKAKTSSERLATANTQSTRSIEHATAAMERFAAPLGKVQALMGAGGLVAAAAASAAAIDKMSQRALALSDVGRNLAYSIDAARTATGGLVSDFALATAAAEANRFGVAKNSAEFAKLAEVASKLARTTGKDTTKAVSDLTTALARGSPQILDNLGLQVDVEKANREYAAALGKTADALTEAEKKTAFMNAAMADAEQKTRNLTVATDGWSVSVQKAKAQAENLLDTLLQTPENIAELRTEIERSSKAAGIATDVWATAARVGLAALTLGGSEAYNAISSLNDEMGSTNPLDIYARALRNVANAADQVTAARAKAQADAGARAHAIVRGHTAQLAVNRAIADAEDSQYFADLDAANARESRGGARAKNKKADNGFAERAAIQEWERLISIRDEARQAKQDQDDLDFQTMDERFDIIMEEKAKREEERLKRLEEAREEAARAAKQRHEDEMARLAELQARQEAVGAAIGNSVGELAASFLAAGDLSVAGFKKVLAGWGRMESIRLAAIAISEGVQAVVSAAFFNFPQAALHGAAAAKAAAAAVVVAGMTGAAGGFGGGAAKNVGGFGGSAFGPGLEPAANDRPSTSNSQTDTTPVSPGEAGQYAQAGAASNRKSRGATYNFGPGSIVSLGAIDEQTGLKLYQGIEKAKRSLGKTGS
jgi:hypothetical protein